MKKLLFLSFLLSTSVFMDACKKTSSDINPVEKSIQIGNNKLFEPDQGTVSNVVKQANTAEVPLETMTKSFEKFDKATGQMIFGSSASELKNLKAGAVVLFTGHSLKKIVNVTETGGKVVVKTTAAKFTEYYKSAKIDYKTGFQWNSSVLNSSVIHVNNNTSARIKHVNGTEEWTYKGTISGWECELALSPETSGNNRKLALNLKAKRGNIAGIEFKGFISNFNIESQINVENSRVSAYSERHNDINGEIEAKYAFLSLSNADAAFEIPIDFFRVMIVHGVIPVTYRIKCVLKVFPEISANSTCQANLKLVYSGSNGFTYENNGLTPSATMSSFEPSIVGETGSASAGIVGVGVGLEFPRFEIGIFDTVVVPYLLTNTSVISYFESGLPFMPGPCNSTKITVKAETGINFSFLGLTRSESLKLYEKSETYKTPGSKCPANSIPFVENAFLKHGL
jgi:hypothetical protein